ncbi:unnamed protein product [Lampetra planeri]
MAHSARRDSPELPDFSLLKRLARGSAHLPAGTGDQRWVRTAGSALYLLHSIYGPFSKIYGIGRCSKSYGPDHLLTFANLKRLGLVVEQQPGETLTVMESKVGKLVNDKTAVRCSQLSLCRALNKALCRLKDIWEEIGIPEDQRLQRNQCGQEPHQDAAGLQQLKVLLEQDQDLSDVLCSMHFGISPDSVPSLEQLENFRQHVANQNAEKEKRYAEFMDLKKQIILYMEELDHIPETSLRKMSWKQRSSGWRSSNCKTFITSTDAIRSEIAVFWEKCFLSADQRQAFAPYFSGESDDSDSDQI